MLMTMQITHLKKELMNLLNDLEKYCDIQLKWFKKMSSKLTQKSFIYSGSQLNEKDSRVE